MALLSDDTVLSVAPEQLSSKLGGEAVVLNLQSGVYYGLNPVAARVWDLVQEGKSVGAIRAALLNEFDVNRDVLEQDLKTLFASMREQGLIQH